MLCSSGLPLYCSPGEAEFDPARPVKLLWIFAGMAGSRTWPYKDIIFYHELSKHNTDTMSKTNPLYTPRLMACQGWRALYAGPPNEMTGAAVRWQSHMTARCHGQGGQMYHCPATREEWHPLNPKRQARCALSGVDNTSVYIRRGERWDLKTADFIQEITPTDQALLWTVEFKKGNRYSIFIFKASNLPKNSSRFWLFFFPKCSIFTSYTTERIIQKDTSLKFFAKEFII